MTNLIALILFIILSAFVVSFMHYQAKENKRRKAWRKEYEDSVKEIDKSFAKLNTACALIKQGYLPPNGESISEIGDDYVVTRDGSGKHHLTILGDHRLH
jgi:hypothetical protein